MQMLKLKFNYGKNENGMLGKYRWTFFFIICDAPAFPPETF